MSEHIPGIQDSRIAELAAVCDIREQTATEIAATQHVKGFGDPIQLMDEVSPDFIIVATPHHAHGELLQAAAERSIHVLKEKPFATSLTEARDSLAVAAAAGVEVMTSMQRRFNPVYNAYQCVADRIGDPFLLDARYTIYTNEPHAGWRGSRALAGGGCVIDMGYHMIDLIIWYFGLPTEVNCTLSSSAVDADYDAEDTACLLMRWDSGLHGNLLLSRSYAPKTEKLTVVGTDGTVEVTRSSLRQTDSAGQLKEHLVREHSPSSEFAALIDQFGAVIRGERPNLAGPEYHLQHAALVESAYESARVHAAVNPQEMLTNASIAV